MAPPAAAVVAVDVVVLALAPPEDDGDGRRPGPCFLAVRRQHQPFAGDWVLPGGVVAPDEDLEQAARRVLEERGGLPEVRHLEQLATFGAPDRDPRGRVVSVSYLGLQPEPTRAGGVAAWHPASTPPPLGFDHAGILASAVQRLRGKLTYSTVAYALLGDTFTLSELQAVYEAVLDRELDKRNFRRKVLSLDVLDEAPGQRRGSHRPAQLYRFRRPLLQLLDDVIGT